MAADFQTLISSPAAAYDEGLRFFNGQGMLNDAISRLARGLDQNEIEYAIIGPIALNQHGYRRFTEDIDLLLTRSGLEKFRERLVGMGYRPAFEGAETKFRTVEENIPIDVITAGEFPGDGLPKPVSFPEPVGASIELNGVRTIILEKLIELKLASGMSASDRLRDLADVQELIKVKSLTADFGLKLDRSVRGKFVELVDAVNSSAERDKKG